MFIFQKCRMFCLFLNFLSLIRIQFTAVKWVRRFDGRQITHIFHKILDEMIMLAINRVNICGIYTLTLKKKKTQTRNDLKIEILSYCIINFCLLTIYLLLMFKYIEICHPHFHLYYNYV